MKINKILKQLSLIILIFSLNIKCAQEDLQENLDKELLKACATCNFDICNTLIQKKANVNYSDENGRTPLHNSCKNGQLYICKLLIENGANPNASDIYGISPLHYTCAKGYFGISKLLIQNGACVNVFENDNHTPLYYACQNKHLYICELLIKNGANINAVCKHGYASLDGALGLELVNLDICKLLIENGANVNAVDKYEDNLLHRAINKGALILFDIFIENGNSDLLSNANKNFLELCKLLIKNGVNVNAFNNSGEAPIHLAALGRFNFYICKLLLENGGDVNAIDSSGDNPLHSAAMLGNKKICALILDYTKKKIYNENK